MAEYELLLPKMGESVAEATIIRWVKQPGDIIREDDEVVEIATDKVDSEVPSPVNGILIKQLCKENEVVKVGSPIAILEIEGEIESPDVVIPEKASEPIVEPTYSSEKEEKIPGIEQLEKPVDKVVEPEPYDSSNFYSPLVRSIAAEEGISLEELDQIKGTGQENRLTKQDIIDYVRNKGGNTGLKENKITPEPIKPNEYPGAASVKFSTSGGDEIIEMDRMRRLIAEHMVMSKQTSPHVSSFVEADVTNIVRWREKIKNDFEKNEGEKITFTPIFIEAVAKAIKDFPMINVSVNGTQIIVKKNINVGMATALPSGNLIVPVIRNTDRLSLPDLVRSVNDLAKRAKNSKLLPDEVQDGTFTVTNIGSFGNIMGIPIINQPQVAILAFGTIKKKPAVIETSFGDMVGIRHLMFLSLSYDHRVVDGALGGSFVKRVADYLESWDIDRKI